MKKYLRPLLIAAAVIQLLVPTYMIWGRYDVLLTGQEVKIKTAPIDPYDAFRGRYVALSYDLGQISREGGYGILETGPDGFARVTGASAQKPEGGLYLTSPDEDYFRMPLDRYYMEETLAPEAERLMQSDEAEAYITVRVKNGKAVISGLYINGQPAEQLLKAME